jgi:hypothetical protein
MYSKKDNSMDIYKGQAPGGIKNNNDRAANGQPDILTGKIAPQLAPGVVPIKIVVVRHEHGYTAYPLEGQIQGAVVGEGSTYEEAYKDVVSALNAHVETFGPEALEADFPIMEAYIAEHLVPIKSSQNAKISR